MSDPVYKDEPELDQLEADGSPFVVPQPAELTTRAPEAPRLHAFAMVIGLFLPFLGLVVAMWLAWQYGWFDRTQFLILAIGYLLTGLGITLGYYIGYYYLNYFYFNKIYLTPIKAIDIFFVSFNQFEMKQ